MSLPRINLPFLDLPHYPDPHLYKFNRFVLGPLPITPLSFKSNPSSISQVLPLTNKPTDQETFDFDRGLKCESTYFYSFIY